MKVIVIRHKGNENYTPGNCIVINDNGDIIFSKKSLERGWQNNQRNISCIPIGNYLLRQDFSPKFNKYLWEIYGTEGRSECKFHAANYWQQLNGCIALGMDHVDINNDGDPDVTSSQNALYQFEKALKGEEEVELQII
ncbi:DUF5675 family protein [Flavobacteriales bacterium]|nr:DUF5675 family protein [Flavobacteriales bacterium]